MIVNAESTEARLARILAEECEFARLNFERMVAANPWWMNGCHFVPEIVLEGEDWPPVRIGAVDR